MRESDIDVVLSPNFFGEKPMKIDDILNKKEANVYEYKMDYFTAVSNCLGVPALTMPVAEGPLDKYDGFPGSIRLQGYFGEDYHVLKIGHQIE